MNNTHMSLLHAYLASVTQAPGSAERLASIVLRDPTSHDLRSAVTTVQDAVNKIGPTPGNTHAVRLFLRRYPWPDDKGGQAVKVALGLAHPDELGR